ncbi:MAG: hypothetical protein ABEJ24_00850 [Candidatus Magasanikbacteria bacterium]
MSSKIKKIFSKRDYFFIFAWFLISFLFFLAVHINLEGFFGSDPYYHATHSVFYQDKLYYTQNWIKLHFFSSDYTVDPYFLFHKMGGEFIALFGKELGFKILGSLMSAVIVSSFYFLLRVNKIKRPHVWTILFLLSSSLFLSRLFLIRSFLLAIPLILFSYYLMKEKRWWLLIILSAFYSLYYTLGVFTIPVAASFLVSSMIKNTRINWKPLLYSFVGVSVGITLHPKSLNYLHQIYVQIIEIFYLKLSGIQLPTGSEINLNSFFELITKNYFSLAIFMVATAVFMGAYNHQKLKKFLPLFLISCGWFIVMMFIPRAIEYWHPFAVFFSASIFSEVKLDHLNTKKIKYKKIIKGSVIGLLSVLLLLNGTLTVDKILANDKDRLDQIRQTSLFLKEKSKKDEVVFFSNWSYFPEFFYFNQKNRYITGFDPVFAYNYNKNKYQLWFNLSKKSLPCPKNNLCIQQDMKTYLKRIERSFKSLGVDYIVLNNTQDKLLLKALNKHKKIHEIFKNEEFTIFKI